MGRIDLGAGPHPALWVWAQQSRRGPDARIMKYRVQFDGMLGPDARVFDTESEAAAYAMANWPDGGWWIIPEE